MRLVAVKVMVRAHLFVAEPVMMLEEMEGVEVVAVGLGFHRRLEVGVEAAEVEGLALMEGVSEAAAVELARRCDLTTPPSDSHARLLSRSLRCPGGNVTVLSDSCFESDPAVCVRWAEWSARGLVPDPLAAVPVVHAHTLLHAPWLLPAASRVL